MWSSMTRLAHRRRTAALAGVLLLALAGAAFAYWTTSGTGSGSATTGDLSTVTVNQTSTLTAMFPGDSPQTLSGTFTNPNSGSVYVGTVTASIASVTKAGGAPAGTCDATDYTLSPTTATVNAQVATGTGGTWSGPKIQFNNKTGADQNACKGATVTLAYAVSG